MLEIEDEDEHARHFWVRDSGSQGLRPMQKYLRSLPEIRRIQDYLVERARRHDVPVIYNDSLDHAIGDVLEVLRDIAEEGRTTMMLVTHEMGFAREVADRVVMFDQGSIVESGPPSQVIDAPQHERTKSFLGAVFEH